MADLEIVVRARDQLTAALKQMGVNVEQLARKVSTDFAGAGRSVDSVRAGFAAVAPAAAGAAAAVDKLGREVLEGDAAMRRLRASSDSAAGGAALLGRSFQGAGALIKTAILPLLPILTLAGAAFAAQRSVQQAVEFQDALSRIRAEAGLTAAEMETLRVGALQTARALGLSEAKAAPALIAAVTDGARSAAEGLDRFTASARLAAALGGDTAKATDLLTSALNAYRDSNLEAGRAADVAFGIVRAGKVEIEELAGAIDPVLPLSAQLGVSFEELGAVIATATDRGGGFTQGMQAVRAVVNSLTSPTKEAQAALAGIDFSSAAIRARGFVPVLVDVARALEGDAEKIRAVFPDGRAFGALLGILSDEGRGLTESLDKLRNSTGLVAVALGTRLQDPAKQLGVLMNRLRSEFSDAFGGAFLRGVGLAIEEMGGLEKATETVALTAREVGEAFGAALPGILAGVKELALVVADVARALKDVDFALFARVGIEAARVVAVPFRALALAIGLVSAAARGVSIADFGKAEAEAATAAVAEYGAGLAKLKEAGGLPFPGFAPIPAGAAADVVRQFKADLEAESKSASIVLPTTERSFADLLGLDLGDLRAFLKQVNVELSGALEAGDLITADAMFSRREQAEVILRARQTAEKFVDEFTTLDDIKEKVRDSLDFSGIKSTADFGAVRIEALALADALVDEASARGRLVGATDDERAALERLVDSQISSAKASRSAALEAGRYRLALARFPSALTVTIAQVGVEAAIAALNGFNAAVASARLAVELEAIEVGLEFAPDVDLAALRQVIDRARLEAEAFKLGVPVSVEVDDAELAKSVADARRQIADALGEIELRALEREAVKLGIELDGQSEEQLKVEIARVSDEVQAFVDAHPGIEFNVGLDPGSRVATEAEVARAIADAQAFADAHPGIKLTVDVDTEAADAELRAFAKEHPKLFEAITRGVDGLSNAIVDVASGAKSAKEAFRDFARQFLTDIARMILQAAIFEALQQSGLFNAQGNVFAKGGVIPPFGGGAPVIQPFALGAALDTDRSLWTKVQPFAIGDVPDATRTLHTLVVPFALGGSPYVDKVVSSPTFEHMSRLAGSAILPLSGGGVETQDGRRLPVRRGTGGELEVRRYAYGGAPLALFGEAGAEAVMRTYRAPGGRLGVRAQGGDVLPLARVAGGRLGVEAFQHGGLPRLEATRAQPGAAAQARHEVTVVEVRPQITVNLASLEGQTAAQVILREKETIAAAVAQEIQRSPLFRASVRGDRS